MFDYFILSWLLLYITFLMSSLEYSMAQIFDRSVSWRLNGIFHFYKLGYLVDIIVCRFSMEKHSLFVANRKIAQWVRILILTQFTRLTTTMAATRHKHFYAILSSTGSTRNLCVRTIRKILEFLAAKTLEPDFQSWIKVHIF